MTNEVHVLISAPYLIAEWPRFESIFDDAGIRTTVPEVRERLSEDELMVFAGDIDGAICGDDRFTSRVLSQAAPRLKVISKWGTGIDSIDSEAAQALGIQICNTPGAFTEAVSDSVMAYMLVFARQVAWLDAVMKNGRWEKVQSRALHECTLGVVGVGRIGKAVLRKAKTFGMKLYGNDIIELPAQFIDEVGLNVVDLPHLLEHSDFVSLNCDLNPTSHHLMDEAAFGFMHPDAVLINTSRGPVVDEQALADALSSGRIFGAALDVFEDEPLPEDSPLLSMNNVLLAPHNANSSPEAYERVHRNTIRNLFIGLGLDVPAAALEKR